MCYAPARLRSDPALYVQHEGGFFFFAGDTMKKPYLKFFVGDWLSEPSLRGVGFYAKGVWMDMMCMMTQGERYGYLCHGTGDTVKEDEVAGLLGDEKEKVTEAVKLLKYRGVFSVDEKGAMYCRRLIRDNEEHMGYVTRSKESGAGRPPACVEGQVEKVLQGSGLVLAADVLQGMKEFYRGVDFRGLVAEAVAEHKAKPIADLAVWLKERAEAEQKNVGAGKAGKVDEEFEMFWKAYPRKVGKLAAGKAWEKANGRPGVEVVLAAVEKQKGSEQWRKDGGQFIPHPATWLNQGRWSDVVGIERTVAPEREKSRDMVMVECVERLEGIAGKVGRDSGEFRAALDEMKEFGGLGRNKEGQTVVVEALEVFEARANRGVLAL